MSSSEDSEEYASGKESQESSISIASDEDSESSFINKSAKEKKKKTTTKTSKNQFKRIQKFLSSSDEEDDSPAEESNVVIPETDGDELSESETDDEDLVPVIPSRRSMAARLAVSDESSDDEEKLRKSFYEAESSAEENEPSIEEKAFSKSTRRSIDPRESTVPDSGSDDDSVVIEETEDEAEPEEDAKPMNPIFSSTIRSPLREISDNIQPISIDDSYEEESSSVGNGAGNDTSAKIKVSRSMYEKIKTEKETLENQKNAFEGRKNLFRSLPDGGHKMMVQIEKLVSDIKKKEEELNSMIIDDNLSVKNEITRSFNSSNNSSVSFHDITPKPVPKPIEEVIILDDIRPTFFGKVGMENFMQMKRSVEEKLTDLLKDINDRPEDTEEVEEPNYLKVELMKHQRQALRFMIWREGCRPRGGILADDMGLGKTLTTISLILKQTQRDDEKEEESEDSSDEENNNDGWKASGKKQLRDGGNLVICPASLVKQWEAEIKSKVKRGALEVNVFHGPKRAYKTRDLCKYDVVLTSYQLAVSEFKNDGILYQIKWKRIVLDEGHVIRNHKSKQSEAICAIPGKYRWVLTGTPIHNKEFDLYAAVKFLKANPFDDFNVWNKCINVKNATSERLQVLLKAILLRRTKELLMESGEITSLPTKTYRQFDVNLNKEERFIYTKVMMYSQAIFANYMDQQMEKNDNYNYDKNNLGKVYRKMAQKFQINHDIKSHEILLLLLRLRQACCHPGLMKAMLEQGELNVGEEAAEHDANDSDADLLKQIENMKLGDDEEEGEATVTQRWSLNNEVFNMDIPSSKIEHMMDVLREHVIPTEDKAIIVSQWTGYLKIIGGLLEVEGVTFCELNGTVPVKNRNDIVEGFNNPNSGIKVMLLSLTAGGVGLNLVGANYLFLMDLHWNPQLEQQAQDRIYRFGQKKDVKIFKFVCNNTIEERILALQSKKLETAKSSLTGSKMPTGSKLTLNDLQGLFGMNEEKF